MQKKCECPHCTCNCEHCRKKEQQIINAGNLFNRRAHPKDQLNFD